MVTAAAVAAVPASATVGEHGVREGRNITVAHNTDYVAVSGYGPIDRRVTVRVVRRGVTVASVSAPAMLHPGGYGLEVNLGVEGGALPGDCWDGYTADIRPGDQILVSDGRGTDSVVVDDLSFTGPAFPDGDDVLVPFRAVRADGTPVQTAELTPGEGVRSEDGKVRFDDDAARVEASGADGEFVLRYSPPFALTRNDPNLGEAGLRGLLLSSTEHGVGFGVADEAAGAAGPVAPETMLLQGTLDATVPALGCEAAAPWATHGVTQVSPGIISAANAAATVTVKGFSAAAVDVEVSLRDGDGTEVTELVTPSGPAASQTWQASFAPDRLADLEGNVKVDAVYDSGSVSGLSRRLVKDTEVPDAPRASLPGGTYEGMQRVALRAGAAEAVRYTLGDGTQPEPGRGKGRLYRGERIRVAATKTLKMVAVDQAGNVSPVVRQRFRIVDAPSRPRIRRALSGHVGGRDTAVARWRAPRTSNGSRVAGYRVTALKLRTNGSVAARRVSPMLPRNARTHVMRLREGRYRFRVQAVNGVGRSQPSRVSNAVHSR
jgi:hypothetical protein